MNDKQAAKKQKMIARIQEFTLMDDDFMTRFFEDDTECMAFVLRTILGKPDLTVTEAVAQKAVKSLKGRSVRLDVFARDGDGRLYDIEIQRADEGAGARRARYNSALMDADETVSGMDTEKLPENYVIFITEHDIYGGGLPMYHIERKIAELADRPFGDGTHIIYVNGEYRGDDPIGSLMHDFSCKEAGDMKNGVLADKAKYLKEDDKGVMKMCKIMEDWLAEELEEKRIESAEEMLKDGSLSVEKIAQFLRLPLETVKKLAAQTIAVQA